MLCVLLLLASVAFSGVISQETEFGDVDGLCPGGFEAHGGSCYGFVDHPQSWADAQSTCAALGGFLAEVYSDEDNEFLKSMINKHGHRNIWIGGDDLLEEGKWYWAKSGVLIDEYTDWTSGQPDDYQDENCLELNIEDFGGHWNDDQCDRTHRFICQKYQGSDAIG